MLLVLMLSSGGLPAALIMASPTGEPVDLGAAVGHQWPMFARGSGHDGAADTFERGINNPGVKWDRSSATGSHGTVIGNFSGNVLAVNSSHQWDGELHCAVYITAANQVHVVEGVNGDDLWVLNLTGTFSSAPALGDVDGDGRTDVVIATRTGVLYAYEPVLRWNGTTFHWRANNTLREQQWNTTGATIGTVTASNLVLDDISQNGTPELVVGTSQGVFCLNARYGNELWNKTVSGFSFSTPAVYTVGGKRNVVATSFNQTPNPDEAHIYTLQGTTGSLIKHLSMEVSAALNAVLPPTTPFFPSPVAGDLDGQADGDELVIVQPYVDTVGRVIAFRDGNLGWSNTAFNKSLGGSGDLNHLSHATPAIADLDGDDKLDVVVASWRTYILPFGTNTYTNVTAFKGTDGSRLWGRDIDVTRGVDLEWALSSPVMLDVDKDDVLDVILMQYNGRINALSGKNGTLLWDLTTRGYPTALVSTSPAVGDLDMDGFPEVVVNSQAVSFLLPDLAVERDDITLTDPTPEEGESVGIDVLVFNNGNEDAEDVLVTIWDGDTLAGNATIDTIVARSSYSARVQHEFYGRLSHTLRVVVDPLDDIEELREDNNEATLDVTIVSKYGLSIECPGNETIVDPGQAWHFFCDVSNLGIFGNRIKVTATDVPTGWTVDIDPANFLLAAKGSSGDDMTVDVEVRTAPTAVADEYPIILTATSQNETRNNDSMILTTIIRGLYGVHLSPTDARKSIAPGDSVVYRFVATNIGNDVDSFDVTATVPDAVPGWQYNLHPVQINALGKGQTKNISISVVAPFGAIDGEFFTVFVKVESIGEPGHYDESRSVTTVRTPDIAVLDILFRRGDGSEVDGDTSRFIVGEESTIAARIKNLRANTDISNLRVRFVVDGVPYEESLTDLPADAVGEATHTHTFTSTGSHTVEVIADPFEIIGDADRSNNARTEGLKTKSRTPVGAFEVGGTVLLADNVTPVSGALVNLEVVSTGYSFTVTADGDGVYMASLADTRYLDGDELVVNATDGRDFAEASLNAYSEDGGATVDLVLSEGIHFNVEMVTETEELDVDNGATVSVPISIRSIGTRGTTLDLSVQSDGWGPSLRDANGTTITQVLVPLGSTVDVLLGFSVTDVAEGNTSMTFSLVATSQEDPTTVSYLNITATVNAVTGFTMSFDAIPASLHPGDVVTQNLTIENEGNIDDIVELTYDLNYKPWNVTFDLDEVGLAAFGSVVLKVRYTVPSLAEAGETTIAISGASKLFTSEVANAYIVVTVEGIDHAVSVTATQSTVAGKPGETVWWQLAVTNDGNVRDRFTLVLLGQASGFDHRFKSGQAAITEVDLEPGATETLILEVDIPESLPDLSSEELALTVKVVSTAEGTAFNNTQLTLSLSGILDLEIDVSISTNSPRQGEQVTFTIHVNNLGPDDASGVMVWAYFGVERTKKLVGDVASGATKDVTIEWFPTTEGPVQVRIVLNPLEEDNPLFETDRGNNEWVKPMRVSGPDESTLWESWGLFIILIIVVVVILVVWFMYGGGGVVAEDVVEVVEEEEDDEEVDEGEDEDLSDDEGYDEEDFEDGDDEDEEYPEEDDEGEEGEDKQTPEADMAFGGGRM